MAAKSKVKKKAMKSFIALIWLRKFYRGQFMDCYSIFFFIILRAFVLKRRYRDGGLKPMADWQFMQVHRCRGQSLGSVWHLRFEIFWEA